MEAQYRVMRGAVRQGVSKVVDELARGGEAKSLRGLVDVACKFAVNPQQKESIQGVQAILQDEKSPYHRLLRQAAGQVEPELLKTVGVNLGFTALTYGVRKLRANQQKLGRPLPWLVLLRPGETDKEGLRGGRMERLVEQGMELGIYAFGIYAGDDRFQRLDLLRTAERHPDCVFAAICEPWQQETGFAQKVAKCGNLAVSVRADGADPMLALGQLREAGCLFGWHGFYSQENWERLSGEEHLSAMAAVGCLFGGYFRGPEASEELQQQVRDFVEERRAGEDPVLLYEKNGDLRRAGRRLLPGGGVVEIPVDRDRSLMEWIEEKLVKK